MGVFSISFCCNGTNQHCSRSEIHIETRKDLEIMVPKRHSRRQVCLSLCLYGIRIDLF